MHGTVDTPSTDMGQADVGYAPRIDTRHRRSLSPPLTPSRTRDRRRSLHHWPLTVTPLLSSLPPRFTLRSPKPSPKALPPVCLHASPKSRSLPMWISII